MNTATKFEVVKIASEDVNDFLIVEESLNKGKFLICVDKNSAWWSNKIAGCIITQHLAAVDKPLHCKENGRRKLNRAPVKVPQLPQLYEGPLLPSYQQKKRISCWWWPTFQRSSGCSMKRLLTVNHNFKKQVSRCRKIPDELLQFKDKIKFVPFLIV